MLYTSGAAARMIQELDKINGLKISLRRASGLFWIDGPHARQTHHEHKIQRIDRTIVRCLVIYDMKN